MPEDTDRTLSYGEVAYNAYCGARDWKSYDGKPLPRFTDPGMKTEIAVAWELAAMEVIMYLRKLIQPARSVTQVDAGGSTVEGTLAALKVWLAPPTPPETPQGRKKEDVWPVYLRVQTSFEA